jgi:E3 ubiquitin-protein ligase DOA10
MSEEKRICRYCHIGDNDIGENDDIDTQAFCSPCLCSGSCRYVHKECLIEWFRQKVTRPVLPGYFSTCNFKCEICDFPYIIEEVQSEKKEKIILFFNIFFAIFILSCIHGFSYFIFGMICSLHPSLNSMFGQTQNDLYTIFYTKLYTWFLLFYFWNDL